MNDNPLGTGAKGVGDAVAGKAKEVAGDLTGKDDLKQEGLAQQDKAENEREAAEHEAKADKAHAKAELDDARQNAAAKQ